MLCSQCGTDNTEGARFCAKCGTALALVPSPAAPAEPVTTMRSPAVPAVGGVVATPTGKTPWIAVVLSLFVSGLGQLYNNDWKKGLLMFGGAVLGLMFTGGIATLAFWIWSMVDAHQVASGKGRVW